MDGTSSLQHWLVCQGELMPVWSQAVVNQVAWLWFTASVLMWLLKPRSWVHWPVHLAELMPVRCQVVAGQVTIGYGPLRQCSSGCCKASPLLWQCTYLQRGSCKELDFWGAIWPHVLVVHPVNVCSLGCKRLRWPWCSWTP